MSWQVNWSALAVVSALCAACVPSGDEPKKDQGALERIDGSPELEVTALNDASLGSVRDEAAAECSFDDIDTSADGAVHFTSSPSWFETDGPYVPEGSGEDGELCWTLCSTERCIPFSREFSDDASGEVCVDKCVLSYQHARAHAPEACLEAMAHRDAVYLSAPCDCRAERVAAEIDVQLDEACSITSAQATGTELGDRCTEHCAPNATDAGRPAPGARCFDECVADLSRHWLLGGPRCLELQADLRACPKDDADPYACEDLELASFYNCLQATR